jgi:exopolyphosphatase/guanosine-5'-triphosphate,3'-diphosphate pyrophosphatase
MTAAHTAGSIQAAIDLGTNTILMVTGRRLRDGSMEVLDDAHEIARLGKGVDEARQISADAMDRVCRLLCQYRQRAEELGATRVRAFGTSALRDAANKTDLIRAAADQAGIQLVELSGTDEARQTFSGAIFGLNLQSSRYAVIDIGGGSTELALGKRGDVEQFQSVDVGAVRVTERFFPDLPPTAEQQRQAVLMIRQTLDELFEFPTDLQLVGVAGTVTTLAAIASGVERFDMRELDGYELSLAAVRELTQQLVQMSPAEISALPQVNDQRADIIGAGSLILRTFLQSHSLTSVTVSTRGIRYGLLSDMLSGRL